MRTKEIEQKAYAILHELLGCDLYEIATIIGSVCYGIMQSTEIDKEKQENFCHLISLRVKDAMEFVNEPNNQTESCNNE